MSLQRFYARDTGASTDRSWTFFSENASDDAVADSFTNVEGYIYDFQGSKRKVSTHRSGGRDATSGTYAVTLQSYVLDMGIYDPIEQLELRSTWYDGVNTYNFKAGTRFKVIGLMPVDVVTDVTGGGGVLEIVAGDNITVDNTDPEHPIVSATSGNSLIPLQRNWMNI
jgi:hypothetical protein